MQLANEAYLIVLAIRHRMMPNEISHFKSEQRLIPLFTIVYYQSVACAILSNSAEHFLVLQKRSRPVSA